MKSRNKNSRDDILACALHLFSARGYDAVGINEITAAAGITKPTLYYFFGSKEGLFRELLKVHYDKLNAALSRVCTYEPHADIYEKDVFPVLLRISHTYFTFAQENPEFYLMALSLTFAPPTSQPAEMAFPFHKTQYDLLENTFRQFSAVHRNLRGKEKNGSWRFLSMINAQIGFWCRGFAKLADEDAHSLVDQFMHGIFA